LRAQNHDQLGYSGIRVNHHIDPIDVGLTLIARIDVLQLQALAQLQELQRRIDADLS
jgi:hypothetical protein